MEAWIESHRETKFMPRIISAVVLCLVASTAAYSGLLSPRTPHAHVTSIVRRPLLIHLSQADEAARAKTEAQQAARVAAEAVKAAREAESEADRSAASELATSKIEEAERAAALAQDMITGKKTVEDLKAAGRASAELGSAAGNACPGVGKTLFSEENMANIW